MNERVGVVNQRVDYNKYETSVDDPKLEKLNKFLF